MPANLRDYVEHKSTCASHDCATCAKGFSDPHELVKGVCDCGLDALLSSSSAARTEGKHSINGGELAKAKRRAMRIFDDWQEVTGALDGTSWLWELESIVEDAVEIGVQAAYGIHKPLEAEEDIEAHAAPSSVSQEPTEEGAGR